MSTDHRLLFLRALLEHPTRFDWSLQGFGMFRLYLSKRTRLHVWDPRFRVDHVTTIHNHPWHFDSEVLLGKMVDRTYVVVPGTPTHKSQQIVCGPGGGTVGTPDLLRLEPNEYTAIRPGQKYRRLAHELHESKPAPGTVTIVDREFLTDTEHALVCHEIGLPWVSAEPRRAERPEVEAMAKIVLAAINEALGERLGEGGRS